MAAPHTPPHTSTGAPADTSAGSPDGSSARTDALVRRLLCGGSAAASILTEARTSTDPLVLTAAALLDPASPALLARAVATAVRTEDRQVTAVAAAHLAGDRDRVGALAREHLLEHPGSVLVAWIAAGARPTPRPPQGTTTVDPPEELS